MMQLIDLIKYAEKRYQIHEEYKWPDFPGFSVLRNPKTGKWIAFLARQWDSDSGTQIECCDIKCGQYNIYKYRLPYFSAPYRMHGFLWLGIRFDEQTNPQIIYRLFDQAIYKDNQKNFTVTLQNQSTDTDNSYQESAIPRPGTISEDITDVPVKIQEMMKLYQLSDGSFLEKCKNFYTQGMFMKDYEDNYLWTGVYKRYFPTYHDLRTDQLRGYFTWRTELRNGQYIRISESLAYIYLYELLNQIGTSSPEETLKKLNLFEKKYIDAGFGDEVMKKLLHRWRLEFCILYDIPPETTKLYTDPEVIRTDESLSVLKNPDSYSDEEIFHALCYLSSTKIGNSPVVKKSNLGGIHLFAEIWKFTLTHNVHNGLDFFTTCFGALKSIRFHPLGNAVYWERRQIEPKEYLLTPCRKYSYKDEVWTETSYSFIYFNKKYLNQLLHESDRKLRIYFKTGHELKVKSEEYWAASYIDAVIESDRLARIEAARPKIHINFSDLEQIRLDAMQTRDSLLTEDEIEDESIEETVILHNSSSEMHAVSEDISEIPSSQQEETPFNQNSSEIALDEDHYQILRMLVNGEDASDFIRLHHLMASVVADTINEALFDEVGDNVVESDGNRLILIEDYRSDVMSICGL